MNGEFKELVGQTIKRAVLEKDGSLLSLTTDDGKVFAFHPEGDCCSTTWIESIDDEDALLGKIMSVENIEMPDLGNIDGKRYENVEEVSYYGLKITTNKGRCVIDYRNSSNGYYGGYLNLEFPS